jgi:hypothetical protein
MCIILYQTYSGCSCFLVQITYCSLVIRLLETQCPQMKKEIRAFPFGCGLEECPRLETNLRFEYEGEEGEGGEER